MGSLLVIAAWLISNIRDTSKSALGRKQTYANGRSRPGAEVQALEINAAELPLVVGRKADFPDIRKFQIN
jgi:hypothetical protein